MFCFPQPFMRGQCIPAWDEAHRLPIHGSVGPHCADSGTVFRINSTYMDVSDFAHVSATSWETVSLPVMMAGSAVFCWGVGCAVMPELAADATRLALLCMIMFACLYGLPLACHYKFFGLSRWPIRFNRKTGTLHAIRGRRYFRGNAGDVTWDIPWDEQQFFCVHKSRNEGDMAYFIRHYALDQQGKIARVCTVGRGWENIENLLAQWSFWCRYMRFGPQVLPRPRMYLSEVEYPWESWLIVQSGQVYPLPVMLLVAPFTLAVCLVRWCWLLTCRAPRWPADVRGASTMDPADPYDEPAAGTPVGFLRRWWAVRHGRYPAKPFYTVPEWAGTRSPQANADNWTRIPEKGLPMPVRIPPERAGAGMTSKSARKLRAKRFRAQAMADKMRSESIRE